MRSSIIEKILLMPPVYQDIHRRRLQLYDMLDISLELFFPTDIHRNGLKFYAFNSDESVLFHLNRNSILLCDTKLAGIELMNKQVSEHDLIYYYGIYKNRLSRVCVVDVDYCISNGYTIGATNDLRYYIYFYEETIHKIKHTRWNYIPINLQVLKGM